ncbi:MAG: lipocalin family protein [Spirochaetaceae bacterium]|nr:lipocalin family protein [Spirochaetaceae bacterium]
MSRNRLFFIMFISFFLLNSCKSVPKNILPVKNFDLEQYMGKWYEIARLDFLYERGMSNITANYSLDENGNIQVVNTGYNTRQYKWKKATGKAKPCGNPLEGALKVSFFGPFYSDYTVLAVDSNYSYALVGGKDYSLLWFLARKPEVPENIKNQFVDMAKNLGYETDSLIWTEHNTIYQ